jgi:hypothetical protein
VVHLAALTVALVLVVVLPVVIPVALVLVVVLPVVIPVAHQSTSPSPAT